MVPLVVLVVAVNLLVAAQQHQAAQEIRPALHLHKAVAVEMAHQVRHTAEAAAAVHQQSAQTLEQVLVATVAMGQLQAFLALQ